MDVTFFEQNLEFLSEEVHNAWMAEKESQGFHSPLKCPLYDSSDDKRQSTGKFTRKCGKCHTDLYPYDELPEHVKEYDRVTVKAVLRALEKL